MIKTSAIDIQSSTPIIHQIVNIVEKNIFENNIASGEQLPTVRELANLLNVSFNTVARAYRILGDKGLIYSKQGRGSYVLDPPTTIDINKISRNKLEDEISIFVQKLLHKGYKKELINRSFQTFLKK